MNGISLTLLLSAIVALALIAKKLRVAYPIVFVLGGIGFALYVPADAIGASWVLAAMSAAST